MQRYRTSFLRHRCRQFPSPPLFLDESPPPELHVVVSFVANPFPLCSTPRHHGAPAPHQPTYPTPLSSSPVSPLRPRLLRARIQTPDGRIRPPPASSSSVTTVYHGAPPSRHPITLSTPASSSPCSPLSLPVLSSCRTETGKTISHFAGDPRARQARYRQVHPSRPSSRADAVSRPDLLRAFGSRSDELDPPDPGQYRSTLSRFVHEPH